MREMYAKCERVHRVTFSKMHQINIQTNKSCHVERKEKKRKEE